MRRLFLKRALAAVGSFSLTGGVIHSAKAQTPVAADFLHIVFIWLKDPVDDLDDFIRSTKEFVKKVPVIKSYHIGTPAATNRPIVDNTYSVCLTVGFENKEGHDIYQEHSAHKAFVEQSRERWEKVLVYDSTR